MCLSSATIISITSPTSPPPPPSALLSFLILQHHSSMACLEICNEVCTKWNQLLFPLFVLSFEYKEEKEAHFTVYSVFWVQNLQGGETKEEREVCTLDGTIDWHGQPAIRSKSGGWVAGIIILCKAPNHLSLSLSYTTK